MHAPRFQPGQQAVVNLGSVAVPCHVFGVEPGAHARRFRGEEWVYHVILEASDFGVDLVESALCLPPVEDQR